MTYFIFGVLPYVALTVLVIGSIVRYERDPFTWKSGSSQLLRRKQLVWGSILFHVGILIVFFGHLVGMLTPVELFHALHISYGFKQILAIVVGGIAGAMAIVGGAMLLHRAAVRRAGAGQFVFRGHRHPGVAVCPDRCWHGHHSGVDPAPGRR